MPDDPETPKENQPAGENGQDNPSSIHRMFGRWENRPKPRQRDYDTEKATQQISDQQTPDQQLIETFAKKLADISREIVDLVNPGNTPLHKIEKFYVHKDSDGEGFSIDYFLIPQMKDERDKPASVSLSYRNTIRDPRINIPFCLEVGLLNDETIQDAIDDYKINNPNVTGLFRTDYYFDENGRFIKHSVFPKEIPDFRPDFYPPDPKIKVKVVESEINPQDFEIASTALITIRDKLRPQTPQTPEP